MKLTRTLATLCTAAAAAVVLSAGTATADDDLLSALNNPAIGAACLPSGQAGAGNTFTGTQNVNCSQSAQSTSGGSGGGLTGYEVVSETFQCGVQGVCELAPKCPPGKKVTGGGTYPTTYAPGLGILRNGTEPGGDNTVWHGAIYNGTAAPVDFTVQAICANASP
ncbi:hypothetical protein ACQKM2_33830 [Streptomyces sp. NPDC004126]|uniref:hypothetical protein n=1 Tax=Streptomyces sp. NPDC004126 TaxID=3390695 RepID=UPI003D03AFC3